MARRWSVSQSCGVSDGGASDSHGETVDLMVARRDKSDSHGETVERQTVGWGFRRWSVRQWGVILGCGERSLCRVYWSGNCSPAASSVACEVTGRDRGVRGKCLRFRGQPRPRVQGFGFRGSGSGVRVQGLGFRVQPRPWVQVTEFMG